MRPAAPESAGGYAAVRAHVIRDGRALLGYDSAHRLWTTFGGKPEPGEPAEDTLRRELREELGIRPRVFSRLADRERDWDGRPSLIAVFAVTAWDGEASNLAPHEHSRLQWFAAGELAALPLADAARWEAIQLLDLPRLRHGAAEGNGPAPSSRPLWTERPA
jgi:8-oxo-dGTP diphosphatase